MKPTTRFPLLAAATLIGVFAHGHLEAAATLTFVTRNLVSTSEGDFHLSVVDGAAAYDNSGASGSPTTYAFGDGTVLDYRFFNSDGDTLSTYANGSNDLISNPSAAAANLNPYAAAWAEVWTTTSPAGFTTTPNFSGAAHTSAAAADVTGTIDISSLQSGSLYFIHGSFVNQWSLTLTMSGSGGGDIMALDNVTINGTGHEGWVSEFSFADAAGYDTITYRYINTDSDGSRARFMGLVVDGTAIPEPSTALLCLIGSLLLLRRRR